MGQIGDPYATVSDMKSYQKVNAVNQGNTSQDGSIEIALDAASRQVEQFCGRQFNKADLATPRSYRVRYGDNRINVDDFWSTDLFAAESDGVPVAADYFDLEPYDGVVDGSPGWPYYRLSLPGGFTFRTNSKVVVTAKWGWAAVPPTVKQATLIIANQLLRLSEAPLGVTGMGGQFGGMIKVQNVPQVATLLQRFVSMPIQVA